MDAGRLIGSVIVLVAVVWLLILPTRAAQKRNVENMLLVNILSIATLFLPLLWFAALYYAYSLPARPQVGAEKKAAEKTNIKHHGVAVVRYPTN